MTEKVVAQLGETIGRQFSYELLRVVSELDEATLQRELGRLVEAELIYQRGLPPQAIYTFKHALVQDTAYESLLRSTRQGYHRRIAEALVERFPDTAETPPELLAHHYTEAGLKEQAVGYWQRAGEKAMQRSANIEAIAQLSKGLELLQVLPDNPKRISYELNIRNTLGPVLMAVKGYTAPEVEHNYAQARALVQQVEDASQLFPVLFGLARFYALQEPPIARELGEQCLKQAEREPDTDCLIAAHWVLGVSLYFLGEFAPAYSHFVHGMTLYDTRPHHGHAALYGQDLGVACRGYAAWSLGMLGYAEQAQQKSNEALALAQELRHTHSQAFALNCAKGLLVNLREWQLAQEQCEVLLALATEHQFSQWRATATMHRGLALTKQGRGEEGLRELRLGLQAWQARGAQAEAVWLPFQVEALRHLGQVDEGLRVVSEALTLVDQTEVRTLEAELYRLKGELLLAQSSDNHLKAETCFHQALDIARRQQAKSLELCAAMSLARLWQSQGKRKVAYDLLAPVYSWFTEGFDTADLVDAKALLDELE